MALDLGNTATQIDGMALELKARGGDHRQRLDRALNALETFSVDGYNLKLEQGGEAVSRDPPAIMEAPASRRAAQSPPSEFCVAASDGSHIEVDRHLPARCFLINTGVSVLTYGPSPSASLYNGPKLFARDDEVVMRDEVTYREQTVEGAVLGARRAVEELDALVEAVKGVPKHTPTLGLLDGSLVVLGLVGQGFHEFVIRDLIEDGFVAKLEDLRSLASDRSLAVASYISLPRSAEVVSALRLAVCRYGTVDAGYRCGLPGAGREPCDSCVGGVIDRELFAQTLEPGERSAMFATSSRVVRDHYKGHDIHFFYVNVGEEIGRVEVPSWVAVDEESLGLVHSLVVDQCRRGRGYPVSLMEAHEQAVVSGSDRRLFVQLVERALHTEGLPVYTSEKARSKRMRWL
jgi:GNAT superfamily N-acetyltransferase